MERTLVLLKPDLVERRLVGTVLSIYEQQGLSIEKLEIVRPSVELAAEHYAEHAERPYFGDLVSYLTRSDVVATVLSGDNAIARVRAINGPTDPTQAAADTVRGRYAISTRENSVHASDSEASALREIKLWFNPSTRPR